ncbi:acyl carrier protein [Celeribacter sp. PS-C1]|uniref:acyl carrier protein n=1 Tax=Celeribacter sp. PS-C1 TaxID=2820813 RepID=UPI001C9342CC|nr:acyl carrier protein [Celeribacter sp. PS-C1]MBW6419746.1 acyl carrier protein [Celeribacter sp. PS-C1]
MDDNQLKDIILNAVAKAAKVDADQLNDSTKLGASGLGLDSIATLELLLTIEAETDVRLRTESLTGDDLATVGGLVQFIQSL